MPIAESFDAREGIARQVKNDLLMRIPAAPLAHALPGRRSARTIDWTSRLPARILTMMHADLIDQEDLLSQLRALGFEMPPGATAEQACECAVRGLDNGRARALRSMVEQMLTGRATILPAVRQALDQTLLPALARHHAAQAS
jgi:hypothetical protein